VVDGNDDEADAGADAADAAVDRRRECRVGGRRLRRPNGAARLKGGGGNARVEAHEGDRLGRPEELDTGEASLPRQPVLIL